MTVFSRGSESPTFALPTYPVRAVARSRKGQGFDPRDMLPQPIFGDLFFT